MNGARALLSTLVANDVTVCFANPGTSEMQFVAALDEEPRMRSVLCLFEGVASGAADGYARMAGVPACTLLHLGPGYANGAANLHNARRACTPIVNVIGDHATDHRALDAPLNSDIATLAAPNSLWVRSADMVEDVAPLAAEAVAASYGLPGGPVSLILPADAAWNEIDAKPVIAEKPTAQEPDRVKVDEIAAAAKTAERAVILLDGTACSEDAIKQAARLDAVGITISPIRSWPVNLAAKACSPRSASRTSATPQWTRCAGPTCLSSSAPASRSASSPIRASLVFSSRRAAKRIPCAVRARTACRA